MYCPCHFVKGTISIPWPNHTLFLAVLSKAGTKQAQESSALHTDKNISPLVTEARLQDLCLILLGCFPSYILYPSPGAGSSIPDVTLNHATLFSDNGCHNYKSDSTIFGGVQALVAPPGIQEALLAASRRSREKQNWNTKLDPMSALLSAMILYGPLRYALSFHSAGRSTHRWMLLSGMTFAGRSSCAR
jgi:hypothetical protein